MYLCFSLQKGMQIIGFQDEEIFSTFELIATILKLGNLEFVHRSNLDGTDGCEINSKYGEKEASTPYYSKHAVE